VLECAEGADLVLVEGQGSIIHPSYSGVTYGLLHGALPHAQILCAQPSRTAINRCEWVKIPPLLDFVRLSEAVAAPLRVAPVIGISLNTYDLDEDTALRTIENVRAPADRFGLRDFTTTCGILVTLSGRTWRIVRHGICTRGPQPLEELHRRRAGLLGPRLGAAVMFAAPRAR